MKKNPLMYVEHILVASQRVMNYIHGISKDDFFSNTLVQDAVIRQLGIMGEAIKKVPKDLQEKYPNVPWSDISKMRDKLIHDYMDINLSIVWNAATNEVPPLFKEVNQMFNEELSLQKAQKNLDL